MSNIVLSIGNISQKIFWERRLFLLRILVIASVLLISVFTSAWASERLNILILVLLIGVGTSLVFLRWPPLGLVTLLIASLVVPFSIGTGTNTDLNITVLILPVLIGLWLADMVIFKRQNRFVGSRTILPLLAFLFVTVVSFGFGQLPWFAFTQNAPLRAQLGGLAAFFLLGGAFLLVAHQVRNLSWLQRLTLIFLLFGGLFIFGQWVPILSIFTSRLIHSRAMGSLFWTWLVALATGQVLFNRNLHLSWRLALGGLIIAIFYSTLGQNPGWTSGWLPSLVGLGVIILIGFPRLAPAMILIGGIVAALNANEIYELLMIGGNRYSLVTRLEAWRILAEIININPILGLGPANYFWYTPLFPILGWNVSFNSHNNYVDILAQTGVLGLAFFLWFMWELGRIGWRLRTQVPDGFAKAYVYGALGGLVGTLAAGMLADWIIPFVYNITLSGMRASVLGWIFLGGLVSVEQVVVKTNDRVISS